MNKILRAAASLALTAALVCPFLGAGCTRTGDESLGMEFLPENQRFEMRHKSFFRGTVRKYDTETGEYVDEEGHELFATTLYRTDSLVSSNLQTVYGGAQYDRTFGKRMAGFATEFTYYADYGLDSIQLTGFEYLPIFDSLTIDLTVSDYGGDTLRPVTYEVYELLGSLSEHMTVSTGDDDDDDSTTVRAYIDDDLSTLYDPSKRLFTFRFPDPENGIYTTTEGVRAIPDDMSKEGVTWNFIKRLMLVSDDPAWDGYAAGDLYGDGDAWMEEFRGLYIKPVDDLAGTDDEGGVYAFELASSGFTLYGRTRNPEEPRLVKDTMVVQYNFYTSTSDIGNNSLNVVSHDYAGSELADYVTGDTFTGDSWSRDENRKARTPSDKGYIEGMGGVVTELYLTDDLLRELRSASAEEGFDHTAVNQARIYIYLDGATSYDWADLDPGYFTPLFDSSLPRLGLYTDLVNITPVSDYLYIYETDDSPLRFSGYLNRSTAYYAMDISSYIQQLKNYVDELNPAGDEDFDYEAAFDPSDENYVSRTLYLAPEAYGFYTMKHSTVQITEINPASVRMELTYTMIK